MLLRGVGCVDVFMDLARLDARNGFMLNRTWKESVDELLESECLTEEF